MTNNPAGLAVAFAYLAAVLLSLPLTVAAWGLSRYGLRFRTALVRVGLIFASLLVAGVLSLVFLVDAEAALYAGGLAVGGALSLGVFPILIGYQLLSRVTPLGTDDALKYATLGWPVGLGASVLLLTAPGGLRDWNVTFLEGVAGTAAFLLLAGVVTFGPAVAGLGIHRAVERFR